MAIGRQTPTQRYQNFEPLEQTPQQKCEQSGGTWDAITKTCIRTAGERVAANIAAKAQTPQDTSKQRTTQNGKPGILENGVFYEDDPRGNVAITNEMGKTTGVEKGGRTLLGLNRQDAAMLAPQGTPTAVDVAQQQADAQRKLQMASQVGQIDFATAQQMDELGINWKEALLAGGANVVPGALTWGATAAGGAVGLNAIPGVGQVGYGVAIAAGATFGAVKSFYSGVTSNIKAQKGDLISGKTTELAARKKALTQYISAANANPAAADEMIAAFNTELSLIRKDYNTLNKEANEDLTLFGGEDGTSQLISYEIFFESVEPSLKLRMEQAVLRPDPTRAYLSADDLE